MKQTFLKRYLLFSAALAAVALGASARQPERGYRGFVDWSNRVKYHTHSNCNKTNFNTGISTSHGYQFNPWLFVGAGIDYTLKEIGKWDANNNREVLGYSFDYYYLSFFGEVRTDLQFGKFTPFADIRLGWNAETDGTVYFSPSIGYRFNWGRKVGINVGVGYTLDAYRYERHIVGTTTDGYQTWIPTGEYFNSNRSSFTFRIGLDF